MVATSKLNRRKNERRIESRAEQAGSARTEVPFVQKRAEGHKRCRDETARARGGRQDGRKNVGLLASVLPALRNRFGRAAYRGRVACAAGARIRTVDSTRERLKTKLEN